MQAKSIAECSKIFVLSIFEQPLQTGFTVSPFLKPHLGFHANSVHPDHPALNGHAALRYVA